MRRPHQTDPLCEGTGKQEVQQALLGYPRERYTICDKGQLCVHRVRCSRFKTFVRDGTSGTSKSLWITACPDGDLCSALPRNVLLAYVYLCTRQTSGCFRSLFFLHVQRERRTKTLNITSQSIVWQVLSFHTSTKSLKNLHRKQAS